MFPAGSMCSGLKMPSLRSVSRLGSDMIRFQPCVGLPSFMLKMTTTPPVPSGEADGACTPEGPKAPKLKFPPSVTENMSRCRS